MWFLSISLHCLKLPVLLLFTGRFNQMMKCWAADPGCRPSFSELVDNLTPEGYGEEGLSHPSTPVWLREQPIPSSPTMAESGADPAHIAPMKPVS